MPKTSDPNAQARLAAQLKANLARRKALIRKREEDPDASSLSFRQTPVHDPALKPAGTDQEGRRRP